MEHKNESMNAFDKAIEDGRLSDKQGTVNYAGDFMYMGIGQNGKALFKHIMSRDYIK